MIPPADSKASRAGLAAGSDFRLAASRLSGRHVRLEALQPGHLDGLWRAGADPGIWRYLPRPVFADRDDVAAWLEEALAEQAAGRQIPYVLISTRDETLVGSSRYLNLRPEDHGLEIGYTWLAPKAQRSGINTEAKLLLLEQAFAELGCLRVELRTDARNRQSQQAIERLGARREGVLRRHRRLHDGHIRDTVVYAITDLDWPALRQRLQQRLAQRP